MPAAAGARFVSPWIDAKADDRGNWQLPEYPCEIPGLEREDPRAQKWRPGDFVDRVDNGYVDSETKTIQFWGGQKMWDGEEPPLDWDLQLPKNVVDLCKVPHMPGQPVKEYFARLKALDPRHFDDRHFDLILRDLPAGWPSMCRHIIWAEDFGIHTEDEPSEWRGQELALTPSAYITPREDTVTICVGVTGPQNSRPEIRPIEGTEYDFLEFLYAKDQEGKIIQVKTYSPLGASRNAFSTYSFVPPKGTTSITPFAIFKIRGAWQGMTIQWDPSVENKEMNWFTTMKPELRRALAEGDKLDGAAQEQIASIVAGKATKQRPTLFPENSWEGNAAKARYWDEMMNA